MKGMEREKGKERKKEGGKREEAGNKGSFFFQVWPIIFPSDRNDTTGTAMVR